MGKQDKEFQSPSLRGSGRFELISLMDAFIKACFNPLHCGAVVASCLLFWEQLFFYYVSIPFIAGQWSLPLRHFVYPTAFRAFQSPSLRGSGRFKDLRGDIQGCAVMFQSPSLRGSGRFPNLASTSPSTSTSFNPLHCGAVVASRKALPTLAPDRRVSIPFIAGQWSLR